MWLLIRAGIEVTIGNKTMLVKWVQVQKYHVCVNVCEANFGMRIKNVPSINTWKPYTRVQVNNVE